jgi:transposase InsO family protein
MCCAGQLHGARRSGSSWLIPVAAHPRLSAVRQPDDLTAELDMLDIPARKRDAAVNRLGIIREFEAYAARMVREGRTRSEALAWFCADRNIGCRSLTRWITAYRSQGLVGLIDTRGAAFISQMISADAFETFKAMYLTQQRKSVKQCYDNICFINSDQQKGWKLPSLQYMYRYVTQQIPHPVCVLFREGLAAYEAGCAPYIESDPASVAPGQIWIGDHHQFNCWVRWRGKWLRPWLTVWQDMRSRAIVGRCVSAAPNQTTILHAMRRGIVLHGPPDSVKIDNGKDYDSEMWTGTTKARRKALGRGYLDEANLAGIYAMMDIGASFSIPYHPQAKAVERFFDTLDMQFTKSFETYCGKDSARKPDTLPDFLQSDAAIRDAHGLDDFEPLVDDYIAIYNNSPHQGRGMDGRTPLEVLAERTSRRVIADGVLDLLMRVWSGVVTIGKNGCRFKGMLYGQYDPELLIRQGQKVRLSYNPDDIRCIHVYDATTYKLITTADQNQLIAYGAAVSEDALREAARRKSRSLKIVRSHRDASRIANMDLPTLTRRAMAAANAKTPPPPAVGRSLRPVATVMDDQVAEHIKHELRKTVKRASGSEQTEVLDFDFSLLKPKEVRPLKLFE